MEFVLCPVTSEEIVWNLFSVSEPNTKLPQVKDSNFVLSILNNKGYKAIFTIDGNLFLIGKLFDQYISEKELSELSEVEEKTRRWLMWKDLKVFLTAPDTEDNRQEMSRMIQKY